MLLIGGLAIIYYLVNFRWPHMQSAEANIYIAQPLMWSALAVMAYIGWRFDLRARPPLHKRLVALAVLTGAFQIAVFVLAGLVYGFGHSPYGHSPLVVLGNMLYVISMLIGVEISRAYLVTILSRGSMTIALLLTSYIFWLLSIPFAKYSSINSFANLLSVFGETFLPVGAENLLASFLALIGGPIVSIAYRGTLLAFEWLSPILPNLHWTITAFVGTMTPVFAMLVIRSQLLVEPEGVEKSQGEVLGTPTQWILVATTAVTLLWFNTGVFGVQPTLVSGVSMEPTLMAGDVVITQEIPAEAVEVGDIIRFRGMDNYILHRVVDIEREGDDVYFITQGDANNALDPPVSAYQLSGKVILTVPKIGWVTIAVRQLNDWIP
jgi:signal peptidase